MKRILIILLFIASCGCPKVSGGSYTNYPIELNKAIKTKSGVTLISNGHQVSEQMLQQIDNDISATENCLISYFKNDVGVLHRKNYKPPKRSCYTVVFPTDIRQSCAFPDQQVFGNAPEVSCGMKGQKRDKNCQCGFRVAIQDGKYIVVSPDLYLFRIGVLQYLTGYHSYYIWNDKNLTKCAGF